MIAVGVVAAAIGLLLGIILGAKFGAGATTRALSEVSYTQAIDRANYLQTLRREAANILIWRDPQRYLALYRQLLSEIESLPSLRKEEVRSQLAQLCEKYPFFSDFDAFGTREYVLYSDTMVVGDLAESEEWYRDMVMFDAMSTIVDPTWQRAARSFSHSLTGEELTHLTEYVQRIEDTKFGPRLEQAMEVYFRRRGDETLELDNDRYTVRPLPHFAEVRYGIHLKRTNEFGIYWTFLDGERDFSGYFRSDPTFEQEVRLNPLYGVLDSHPG